MPHPLWILHLVFWLPFLLRGQVQRMSGTGAHHGKVVHAHPRAVALVGAHTVAAVVMYVGIGVGVRDAPGGPSAGLVAGTVLAVAAILLARWTLRTFRSWRLRAEITEGHQLSLAGPFRWVRHPIYAAMDLLALATFVWVPHPLTGVALLLMVVVGDVRSRAEEGLLLTAFGEEYRGYMDRVKRLVPGVY